MGRHCSRALRKSSHAPAHVVGDFVVLEAGFSFFRVWPPLEDSTPHKVPQQAAQLALFGMHATAVLDATCQLLHCFGPVAQKVGNLQACNSTPRSMVQFASCVKLTPGLLRHATRKVAPGYSKPGFKVHRWSSTRTVRSMHSRRLLEAPQDFVHSLRGVDGLVGGERGPRAVLDGWPRFGQLLVTFVRPRQCGPRYGRGGGGLWSCGELHHHNVI